MPLLTAGNTEFAASITRKWSPHYKSKSIDLLEAALLTVQRNPAHNRNLVFLYAQLGAWIHANPSEFAKRGTLVGKLAYEIEQKAVQLGAPVTAEAALFRRYTAAAANMWTPLRAVADRIAFHSAAWGNIRVTDLPINGGGYAFTESDGFSKADKTATILEMVGQPGPNGARLNSNPNYWVRLGRRVLTPQLGTANCYGRCFSCASAAIYTLLLDPRFDDYTIEHVANELADHHLVLVGRLNANGVSAAGLNAGWEQYKHTAMVVDLWQGNLNLRQGRAANYATMASQNPYANANLHWYCAWSIAGRAADRANAIALAPIVRVAPRLDLFRGARLAALAPVVGNPGYRREGGRWVPDV